jgi:Na+-transporting methylmalonyl-CoA/oxaloacetate decarboxylase gamma subunit
MNMVLLVLYLLIAFVFGMLMGLLIGLYQDRPAAAQLDDDIIVRRLGSSLPQDSRGRGAKKF